MLGMRPEEDRALAEVKEQAEIAGRAYALFQDSQVVDGKVTAQAKADVQARLDALDARLDAALAHTYGVNPAHEDAYARWRDSHKPFHWLTAFYGIMERGGFDVIIGNPPYVEYRKVSDTYTIRQYATGNCGNLYAFCVERSLALLGQRGALGMIVPISLVSSKRMLPLRVAVSGILTEAWYSNFAIRPQPLFPEIMQRHTVVVGRRRGMDGGALAHVTGYQRWQAASRSQLFERLEYSDISLLTKVLDFHPKLGSREGHRVARALLAGGLKQVVDLPGKRAASLYFHDSGESYWTKAALQLPVAYRDGVPVKPAQWFQARLPEPFAHTVYLILNSNLAYWLWTVVTDCRHMTQGYVEALPVPPLRVRADEQVRRHATAYRDNTVLFEKRPGYRSQETKVQEFKPIIDEIDTVLARHYGFTEEELDFIINYDIKYRMGDALNEQEDAG